MRSLSEIRKTLKNQPFYSEEIKRKKKIAILSFYLNYHFFLKNLKN